jgi:hypothetical protein
MWERGPSRNLGKFLAVARPRSGINTLISVGQCSVLFMSWFHRLYLSPFTALLTYLRVVPISIPSSKRRKCTRPLMSPATMVAPSWPTAHA